MDQTPFFESLVTAGIAQCSAAIDGSQGLLLALFMAGFAGGVSHCVGMCGPFVISQVQARLQAMPAATMNEFKRMSGGALIPYHLGRATSYMALGAVGAVATAQLAEIEALHWVAAALLAGAALFFIGYALRGLGITLPKMRAGMRGGEASSGEGTLARAWGRTIKPLFRHPTGFRGYALGVALGFLPCGLLYGALAAAAAGGDWLIAVFAMAAFWLGTVPALVGVGMAGGTILGRWPDLARQIAPVLLLVNGAFLLYLVVGMLP